MDKSPLTSFPFNPELQKNLVSWLIHNPSAWAAFGDHLKPSFFDDDLAPIMSVLQLYYERYRRTPEVATVLELIRKQYGDDTEEHTRTRNRLNQLTVSIYEINVKDKEFLEEHLRKYLAWKAVTAAIMKAIPTIQQGKYEEDLPEELRKAIQIGSGTIHMGLEATDEKTAVKVIMDNANPDRTKICSTGLPHLDREIGGGHRNGELGIILAPPKGFKSGCLMNFACAAARRGSDRNVVYFSLELSEELQLIRYALRTTMLDKNTLKADPESYVQVFQDRLANIYGGRIFFKFIPPGKCTPNIIRAYLDQFESKHGVAPGMVAIDYMDLMSADKRSDKDYMDKVQIATEVRSIAEEYNLPVWTACRATREATSKKVIRMEHMSGAYERVGVADRVLAHSFSEIDKAEGRSRLTFVAERNEGGNCIIKCSFRPEVMCITSVGTAPIEEDEPIEDTEEGQERGGGRRNRRGRGNGGHREPESDVDAVSSFIKNGIGAGR